MTIKLPSPTELKYFQEVAASANLSRAAKKLNISQPSLSMAIKRLEQTLKTTLFYRDKSGVTLTRPGNELLHHVNGLLAHWENITQQIRSTQQEVKGHITIGFHTMMTSYLGAFVSDLLNKFPAVEINLQTEASEKIVDLVMSSSIDVGIVLNPTKHANLIINKILETDYTFWTGSGNSPLQTLSSGQAVIICDTNLPQCLALLKQLDRNKIAYARLSNTNGMDSIASLTFHGCGVGILPSCYVAGVFKNKLRRVSDAPYINNETCMIYRYENKEILLVQTIISEIKKLVKLFK